MDPGGLEHFDAQGFSCGNALAFVIEAPGSLVGFGLLLDIAFVGLLGQVEDLAILQ